MSQGVLLERPLLMGRGSLVRLREGSESFLFRGSFPKTVCAPTGLEGLGPVGTPALAGEGGLNPKESDKKGEGP
jgi:hypothetical protein